MSSSNLKGITPKRAVELLIANDEIEGKVIDLSGNTVFTMKSLEYCEAICNALKENVSCEEIHLQSCNITDAGAQLFAEMLKVNATLRVLDLEKNKISNDGATMLAEGLKSNTGLIELRLLGQPCNFGDKCLSTFIEMFSANTSLRNIVWRLESRQSFAVNKLLTRNKDIYRRLQEGRSLEDFDPAIQKIIADSPDTSPLRSRSKEDLKSASSSRLSTSSLKIGSADSSSSLRSSTGGISTDNDSEQKPKKEEPPINKAETEAKRKKEEEDKKKQAEAEANKKKEDDDKRKQAEADAKKKKEEEENKKKADADAKSQKEEEEKKKQADAEANKKKEEEKKNQEEEAKRKEAVQEQKQNGESKSAKEPKPGKLITPAVAASSPSSPMKRERRKTATKALFKAVANVGKLTPRQAVNMLEANDSTLVVLDLANNTTFQMHALEYSEAMCKALKGNKYCEEVHLSNCGITDACAKLFGEVLMVNNNIEILDLEKNKISNDGATAIAEALKYNTGLIELRLLGQPCHFGDKCLATFIEMFDYNTTLRNIVWRLESRKSFLLNKMQTRNKDIFRRLQEGRSLTDFDPSLQKKISTQNLAGLAKAKSKTSLKMDDKSTADSTTAESEKEANDKTGHREKEQKELEERERKEKEERARKEKEERERKEKEESARKEKEEKERIEREERERKEKEERERKEKEESARKEKEEKERIEREERERKEKEEKERKEKEERERKEKDEENPGYNTHEESLISPREFTKSKREELLLERSEK